MKLRSRLGMACGLAIFIAIIGVWAYAGTYGLHVVLRHGGTYWITVAPDSPLLSPAMRLALAAAPEASAGEFQWRPVAGGFETADLPVMADGKTVDHILLARIDPAHFRFVVRTDATGNHGLDQWMAQTGAALIVNGSYYARYGEPDTPLLSGGVLLGPKEYDAKAGVFAASADFAAVRDLAGGNWQAAFQGADNGIVSYPLLVAGGTPHVVTASRWLANRSFVGQESAGLVIIGTTADAFFSLDRLARFLHEAPLDLTVALNLDGGPVANQGISLNGFERRTYGKWEAQVHGDQVRLLTWPYGTVAMPVVLAVLPK